MTAFGEKDKLRVVGERQNVDAFVSEVLSIVKESKQKNSDKQYVCCNKVTFMTCIGYTRLADLKQKHKLLNV